MIESYNPLALRLASEARNHSSGKDPVFSKVKRKKGEEEKFSLQVKTFFLHDVRGKS